MQAPYKADACATHMDALAMTIWCIKHVKALTSCFLISKSTVNVPEMAATCPFPIPCACCLVQANTELILGFEPSAVTDELVARQQLLWKDWVQGLVSLPINLPGFGNACPLTNQTAYSLLHMHGKISGQMHMHNHLPSMRSHHHETARHPLCHISGARLHTGD